GRRPSPKTMRKLSKHKKTRRKIQGRPIVLLFSPLTLGERRHRRFACRLVSVRRSAALAFSDHPHPRTALQSNGHQKDAANDDAVFENLVVLLIPADGHAFEDQRGHLGGGGGGGGGGLDGTRILKQGKSRVAGPAEALL